MQRECYWLLGKVLAQVNTPQSTATNPTSKRARGPAHHLAFLPLTFQAIIARSIRRRCLLPITSATLIQRVSVRRVLSWTPRAVLFYDASCTYNSQFGIRSCLLL